MNAVEAQIPASWRACLRLGYERRGPRSVLATRAHVGPLLVQKPLYPEGPEICQTLLVHPPGGLAAGDELRLEAAVAAQAQVLFTTPGATRWYRSEQQFASQCVHLSAGAGAAIEWLPNENIVYRNARARAEFELALAPDARFIGWDLTCLGRVGAAERFDAGTFENRIRILRGGKLIWQERASIEGGCRLQHSTLGLGGAPVFASVYAVGPGLDRELVEALRVLTSDRGAVAVTRLPDLVIARYLGGCTEDARAYCTRVWRALRPRVLGREAVEPRIWRT